MTSLGDILANLGVTTQTSAPEAANTNWRMPEGTQVQTPLGHPLTVYYGPGGGYPEGSPMYLQDILNGHLETLQALNQGFNRANNPSSAYYDPARARFYSQVIDTTNQDIAATRARLNAVMPKSVSGALATMPLTSPTMVTRPGSGGLFNEEELLQRQREGLAQPPPGQGD